MELGFDISDSEVDTTLIDYFLTLSPEERFVCNERNAQFLVQLRQAAGVKDDRFSDTP